MKPIVTALAALALVASATSAVAAEKWRVDEGPRLSTARVFFGAGRSAGKTWVVGGERGDYLDTTEFLQDGGSKWEVGPRLRRPRGEGVLAVLPDGSMVVAGGTGGSPPTPVLEVEILRPGGTSWEELGVLVAPLPATPAAAVVGEQVFLFGAGATVQVVSKGGVTTGRPLASPRLAPKALALKDGGILLVGGADSPSATPSEIYYPTSSKPIDGNSRVLTEGCLVQADRVLLIGGFFGTVTTYEALALGADAWESVGIDPQPRSQAGCGVFRGGALLVGGLQVKRDDTLPGGLRRTLLSSVDWFDGSKFTRLAPLLRPRFAGWLTQVSSNRWLLVGGITGDTGFVSDTTEFLTVEAPPPDAGPGPGPDSTPAGGGCGCATATSSRSVLSALGPVALLTICARRQRGRRRSE